VSSFIDATTITWKVDLLEECFLPMDREAIRVIPLSNKRMEDIWSWHYEKNGVLLVHSVISSWYKTNKRRGDWLEGAPS
jgi:hypothetical protein